MKTSAKAVAIAMAGTLAVSACESNEEFWGTMGALGGAVAAGLSGPRRPWAGAVRDYVLGTRVITGHGKLLRFGGEVMKNVAGYDVSRLMAGSYGCLGVLTEVSLKVLPKPRQCLSIRLDMECARALANLAREDVPDDVAAAYQGNRPRFGAESGASLAGIRH